MNYDLSFLNSCKNDNELRLVILDTKSMVMINEILIIKSSFSHKFSLSYNSIDGGK